MSKDIEATGYRWQNAVANFIRELKPNLVVETGVSDGVSTIRFLAALDAAENGRLVSVDPAPNFVTPHPRWTLHRATSHRALGWIFAALGPFDVFIHDSDHDAECQAFEYAVAWHFVRPGGYIISDDISWGTHRAWPEFTMRYNLAPRQLGHAGLVQKPSEVIATNRTDAPSILNNAWLASQTFARANNEAPKYVL